MALLEGNHNVSVTDLSWSGLKGKTEKKPEVNRPTCKVFS